MQSITIRAGEEEFVSFCMDSDLGRAMLLNMAEHFLSRLRDKVKPHDWSNLALEAAGQSGVAKVVLDTLSDTPAAKARGQGSITLVPDLAEQMWERGMRELEATGHHAPLSCGDGNQRGSGCLKCHRGMQPWNQLSSALKEELERHAKGVLETLNQKGLLP